MDYATCLKDLEELRAIANGWPHDGGEILEEIASTLLRSPTKAKARDALHELIVAYYERGDAKGESLTEHPEAQEIFRRYGLLDEFEDDD